MPGLPLAGEVLLARMAGSSVVAPAAMPFATDLLAAAWFARPAAARDVDDLRLAHAVLATRWARTGRRLGARDLPALHRAFGPLRLTGARGGRFGTLDRAALLEGGARLVGPWFPAAWEDPRRRGWGVVFETARERAAFVPERRLEHAALRRLTPPRRPLARQCWHTYPWTALPDTDAALGLLREPSRWPDFAAELGRFTPLRSGGLQGQTFEIEVAVRAVPRAPAWTRGYVTAVRVLTGAAAASYARGLERVAGARVVEDEVGPVRAAVELVTHEGHFLGRAVSRLVVGEGWIRDVGSWDPLGVGARVGYELAGARAQREFWGDARPERSMLQQLALVAAAG
ncbi:hypothetical protein [Conexibacter sp. SYSU D00693]|uniref:hypothetical protein n=1 Tax=Conexibacter sp. SYSU D00693 TaxID=2812560 RepID=UPI00196A4B5D|nr:hypothetical protein [Conexibacter sp. SYSU D00693]